MGETTSFHQLLDTVTPYTCTKLYYITSRIPILEATANAIFNAQLLSRLSLQNPNAPLKGCPREKLQWRFLEAVTTCLCAIPCPRGLETQARILFRCRRRRPRVNKSPHAFVRLFAYIRDQCEVLCAVYRAMLAR
jgi:hypothetical protein